MHAPFELIFSHLSVDWDCRLRNRDRSPVPRRRIEFRAGRTIKEIAERTIRVFPAAASERQSSYAQARRPPGAGDSLSVSFDESMQQARVTTGFSLVPGLATLAFYTDRFSRRDDTAAPDSRSLDMKLRLLMVFVSALLFLAPRAASAGDMTSEPGVGTSAATPASERLMNHANESAQATTDMSLSEPTGGASQPAQNVSYGGVAAGHSEAGSRQNMRCSGGPQCTIYFGQ
jgi:hypothetical protein